MIELSWRRWCALACAVPAIAMVVSSASAQVAAGSAPGARVVRQTLPNGTVLYTDAPIHGLKIDRVLERVRATDALRPQMTIESQGAGGGAARREPGAAGAAELAEAEQDLADALEDQAAGREERDGDRMRTAFGRMRLTEQYQQRQGELQRGVDTARTALQTLQKARQ